MKAKEVIYSDVLVIGTGIAGCACALELAEKKIGVCLLTSARDVKETNTKYAQGGIVYRCQKDPNLLIKDTIKAGAGRSKKKAVVLLAKEGPKAIERVLFEKLRMDFDRDKKGKLEMRREGGHSCFRIIHIKDETGRFIENAFIKKIKNHPFIKIYTDHTLIDLIVSKNKRKNVCLGGYVLDEKKKRIRVFLAKKTVLATGGAGQLFLRTSNSKIAQGSGIAVAHRAGAHLEDVEFVQFHPTGFYHQQVSNLLITESLRGEGAKLKNHKGELFMKNYHPLEDLAPRDIATRAIYDQMLKSGKPYVFLDAASYIPESKIKSQFPHIYKACLKYGFDITKEALPVSPVAHFLCGGVKVDLWGKTSIKNLYAVGEVSCTGVHGANRLASNSLSECLVWGIRAAENISSTIKGHNLPFPKRTSLEKKYKIKKSGKKFIQDKWSQLRSVMSKYVGIIRTPEGLKIAIKKLTQLEREIEKNSKNGINKELLGLRDAVQTGIIIAKAAERNKKSQGCHFILNPKQIK